MWSAGNELTKERLILLMAQMHDPEFNAMILQYMHKHNYPYKSSDTSVPND